MGNYINRILSRISGNLDENDEIQSITEQKFASDDNTTCTPLSNNTRMLIDPRSATSGILRTPIEVECTPTGVSKREHQPPAKCLQRKKYLETDIDVVMPPLPPKKPVLKLIDCAHTPESDEDTQIHLTLNSNAKKNIKLITPIDKERYKILGLDPRSPAADFDRTPILLPRSLALIKTRSQEQLSRRGSYETDIYNGKTSCKKFDMPTEVLEIQSLPDITSEGLETLDSERQEELDVEISLSATDSIVSESDNEVTVIRNPKFKNDINKQTSKNDKEKVHTDKQCDVIDSDQDIQNLQNDDKIKIWHDLSSLKHNVSNKVGNKKSIENKLPGEKLLREDVIITFDEDTVKDISSIKTTKINADLQKKADTGERKKINLKFDVKSKLDNKNIFSPDKYGNETAQNRTPLSNRSNDITQGLSIRSPQLLTYKTIATKIQQENTPPHKKYTSKIQRNGIQWDLNSTFTI